MTKEFKNGDPVVARTYKNLYRRGTVVSVWHTDRGTFVCYNIQFSKSHSEWVIPSEIVGVPENISSEQMRALCSILEDPK